MATIQQRKDSKGRVHHRVMVRIRGCGMETATFERLTDARRWAQQTEAAIREGRYFRTAEGKRHTVTDLVERYIKDIVPGKKSGPYYARHLSWWQNRIGHLALADVTPVVLVEHRDALRRETGDSNANRYMAALSHAFTLAVREWGWCDDTPFRKVKRLKEPRGVVRFLDDDERARLLAECRDNPNPHLYDVVLIALTTGCRKNEILSLRWPDVDLDRNLLILHDTKNNERRNVPLVEPARDRMHERARIRRIDTNLVFPCLTKPSVPADIDRDFARARAKAGIKDFRFHDLRHSCASYLAMNGATLAEIAAVLGHKTLSMVKRYSHLSESHTTGVVERMAAKVFGNGKGAETNRA